MGLLRSVDGHMSSISRTLHKVNRLQKRELYLQVRIAARSHGAERVVAGNGAGVAPGTVVATGT